MLLIRGILAALRQVFHLSACPNLADYLSNDYNAYHASIINAIETAQITPVTLSAPQHIAFVGGFFDSTISALGADGTVENTAKDYAKAHPGVDVQYFIWDQGDQLSTWAKAAGGEATVIAHSYGADTAATVVANGAKVKTLVTLDPVSFFRPDFSKVAANAGQWLDYNATGGGLTVPNAIAGGGSAWNNAHKTSPPASPTSTSITQT